MTIQEVNSLEKEQFVQLLGWVFEHSPWVAERAWARRPFADLDTLHAALVQQVQYARAEEQLALLRAHPDLGTRARITDASSGEQAGAGLDRLTPEEFDRLTRLNTQYRERFGFPFLLAVKGSTKHDILGALDRRISSSVEQEYKEALDQVQRIARFRLDEFLSDERTR